MRKTLLAASLLLLTLSAVFGVLNSGKVKSLRSEIESAAAARALAENARAAQRKEIRSREGNAASATAKFAQTEARVASAETELVKSQSEKKALEDRLQADEAELMKWKTQSAEATPKSEGADEVTGTGSSTAMLQAQLEETRKQLDDAEREKTLLAERVRAREERAAKMPAERIKRRSIISQPGVRCTIMAVNQAYNFVVLNLGERHGLELNSEMLIMRGGTLIGKIRVSSVEPTTAIGDIIGSSLARGVQVQPGDIVIYAGTNS